MVDLEVVEYSSSHSNWMGTPCSIISPPPCLFKQLLISRILGEAQLDHADNSLL
jgi:hypothetical protein